MRIALRCDPAAEIERLRRFEGDQVTIAEITDKPLLSRDVSKNVRSISGDPQTLQAALISETPDLTIAIDDIPPVSTTGVNAINGITAQRFDGSSLELPKSDIVLFTDDADSFGRVRIACSEMVRWEAQQKGIVFGVGAATIAAALLGLGSPVIAVLLACGACLLSLRVQKRVGV